MSLNIQTTTLIDFKDVVIGDTVNVDAVNVVSSPAPFSDNASQLELVATAATAISRIEYKNTFGGLDLTNKTLGILVYRPPGIDQAGFSVELLFSDDVQVQGNDYEGFRYDEYIIREGWNYLTWYTGQDEQFPTGRTPQKNNTIDWSNINSMQFNIRNLGNSTNTSLFFDRMEIYTPQQARFTLGFDTADTSVVDYAMAGMDTYGFKGYVALEGVSGGVNTSNTVYANGWEIIGHSVQHIPYTGQSAEWIKDETLPNLDYLRSQGWVRSNSFYAYPQNDADKFVQDTMQSLGVVSSRGSKGVVAIPTKYGVVAPLEQPSIELGANTTLTYLKQSIDYAVIYGATQHIFGHELAVGSGTPPALTWWVDDFNELMEYINSSNIQNELYSESHYRLSGEAPVTEQQKGQVLGEFTSSVFKNADAMMGDAGADFWQTPSVDMRLKSISLAVCPAYGGPDLDFTLKLFDAVAADTALVNEVAGAEGEFTGLAPAVYSSNAGNLDVTDSAVLVDNDRDGAVGTPLWTVDEWIGAMLVNATDGSYGVITSNTVNGATATLAGGSNNFWSATDDYYIMKLFTKEFSTHIVLDPTKWYGVAMQANAGISGFRIAKTDLADRTTAGERVKVNNTPLTYPDGLDSPLIDDGVGFNAQLLFSAVLSDEQAGSSLTTPYAFNANTWTQKKDESFFAGEVAEGFNGFSAADEDYLLLNLPWNCLITDAYIHVISASDAATSAVATLGTTEGGSEILSAADLTTTGKQGTAAAQQLTGLGREVYLGLTYVGAATDVGEYLVVIEYLEYNKTTGEYTKQYTFT